MCARARLERLARRLPACRPRWDVRQECHVSRCGGPSCIEFSYVHCSSQRGVGEKKTLLVFFTSEVNTPSPANDISIAHIRDCPPACMPRFNFLKNHSSCASLIKENFIQDSKRYTGCFEGLLSGVKKG